MYSQVDFEKLISYRSQELAVWWQCLLLPNCLGLTQAFSFKHAKASENPDFSN